MQLVLLVGTKLQHVIATLAIENAGITGFFAGAKLRPRDDLFWFKKPELLLSLIHFILFQVSNVCHNKYPESITFNVVFVFIGTNCPVLLSLNRSNSTHDIFFLSLQNAFELASFFWFWVLFSLFLSHCSLPQWMQFHCLVIFNDGYKNIYLKKTMDTRIMLKRMLK